MTKRLAPLLLLFAACSTGTSDDSPTSFSAGFTGNDGVEVGDGDGDESGDGDEQPGDGDGEPSSGDGDGDGDGEPNSTGDGDGELPGDGDGEEEVDPCPLICDGKAQTGPNTCDKPYFVGRTKAKAGFFYGGSTQGATDNDNGTCGPKEDPANWDSGRDHFFRIYMVIGDRVTAVQNPSNWKARLKIHDEAECIGNARVCSSADDPAEILDYEALKSDWYTIVVDGQSAGFMDWGDYTLTIDLEAGGGIDECGCP